MASLDLNELSTNHMNLQENSWNVLYTSEQCYANSIIVLAIIHILADTEDQRKAVMAAHQLKETMAVTWGKLTLKFHKLYEI